MTKSAPSPEQSNDGQAPTSPVGGFATFSADDYKAFFRHHPGGVALITAVGPNGPVALTATSVASVSAEPPLLVFSVSSMSSSLPTLKVAETVVVHLLGADDIPLAKLGATSGIDRFADTSLWTGLVTGEPVFHRTRWVRARVLERVDAGGSVLIVGQAIQSNVSAAEPHPEPVGLAYVNRQWHRLTKDSLIE